jgi:uncharacterized protein (TIRG00374 family)
MKRLIALGVSIVILGAIFLSIDREALWANLRATQAAPFFIALFLFIPQNALMAYRWKMMAGNFIPMSWGRSIGLILAGQTMNVLLPSKLGDLTKAYFLKRAGALDLPRAANLVVFEKMLDLGSLCLLALAGVVAATSSGRIAPENTALFALLAITTALLSSLVLLIVIALYFVPPEKLPILQRLIGWLAQRPKLKRVHSLFASSHEVISLLQRREARRGYLSFLSVILWVLHLIQIYYFFLSLNAPVPIRTFAALMPLAIFIGLLPLSLFGMGTRDAAIILLFSAFHPPAVLTGVGLYVSLRYVIPAIAGLPFLQFYMSLAREVSAEAKGTP